MASESLDGTYTFFDTVFGAQAQELGLSANAPNVTPWYKTCSAKAIGSGLLHIGIDAIGLIPEAEGFTKVFENTAGYQIAKAWSRSHSVRNEGCSTK